MPHLHRLAQGVSGARQKTPCLLNLRLGKRLFILGVVAAGLRSNVFTFQTPSGAWQAPRQTQMTSEPSAVAAGRVNQLIAPSRHINCQTSAMPEAFTWVSELIDQMPQRVAELGPLGPAYFILVYIVAECLALPALPLTLSSGYLFGLPLGVFVTLVSGTVAAAIGFTLSRTFLRPQIEKLAAGNEQFRRINLAVEKEGLKIIFLLRLSPLLPFAISNYVFGLSSVGFFDFLVGTALGFAPGTIGYVYMASTARDLVGGETTQPWYIYAVGFAVTALLLKVVTQIAQEAVDEAVAEAEAAEAVKTAQSAPSPFSFFSDSKEPVKTGSIKEPPSPFSFLSDSKEPVKTESSK